MDLVSIFIFTIIAALGLLLIHVFEIRIPKRGVRMEHEQLVTTLHQSTGIQREQLESLLPGFQDQKAPVAQPLSSVMALIKSLTDRVQKMAKGQEDILAKLYDYHSLAERKHEELKADLIRELGLMRDVIWRLKGPLVKKWGENSERTSSAIAQARFKKGEKDEDVSVYLKKVEETMAKAAYDE